MVQSIGNLATESDNSSMNLSADVLEHFLNKMPIGIAIFNHDCTLRQFNEPWAANLETISGIPAAAIRAGMTLDELLPEQAANIEAHIRQALAGKSYTEEALPLTTPKGNYYWNAFFSPLHEQGERVGALLVITDVTRRQQAEAAAQTAEQALLTLMDSLPGMAYRGPLAAEREMDLVNNGVQELTGYLPHQLIRPAAIPYASIIHEEDRAEVWIELKQAVQGKRSFELLYRIRTANNQIKWVLEQGSGLYSPQGDLLGVEGFISDITEQVLAQQILEQRVIDRTRKLSAMYEMMALAAVQEDLKTSLQHALSWVLTAVHGQAGFIQIIDPKTKNLHLAVQVGLTPEVRESVLQVSPESGLWRHPFTTQKPFAHTGFTEAEKQSPFLEQTTWETYAGLPMSGRGDIIGILNVWRETARPFSESDVALMAAAAEQMGTTIENARLRRENDRLVVLDERNRLARDLHDAVTQSLYSLTLFAEANQRFAKMNEYEHVQQYSQRISDTAERSLKEMRLLLHNLRPSILQQTGLAGALQQRLDSVEKRAGIQARLLCGDQVQLPPHVEETLFHISEEALNNSLKHSQATAVTVTITQSGTEVKLEIKDNGRGFDETVLPDEGGLGLTSMRERVVLLGGSLNIQSQPEATTVTIIFDLENIKVRTASQNLLNLLQE